MENRRCLPQFHEGHDSSVWSVPQAEGTAWAKGVKSQKGLVCFLENDNKLYHWSKHVCRRERLGPYCEVFCMVSEVGWIFWCGRSGPLDIIK